MSQTCSHEDCGLSAVGNKGLCARHMAAAQPRAKSVTSDQPVQTAESSDDKFASDFDGNDKFASEAEAPLPRRKKPERRPQSEQQVDPEVIGGRIAEVIVAQQMQEAKRKMKRRQVPRDPDTGERLPVDDDEPPRVPLKLYSKRKRRDSTAIVDPETGESLLKPGYVGRWVRQVDHLDRPTEQRVVEMEDYGYEVVKRPDGTPLTSYLGIAMQAPPEQYALRCVDKSPPGALHAHEQVLEDTYNMVEQLNSAAGDEVARFVQAPDHAKEVSEEKVFKRGA